MGLKADLENEVKEIFDSPWEERDGQVVPDPEDLKLGNDAVKLQATVLYADMADSTVLVEKHTAKFAAEVYKAYLHCAAKIIKNEGGVITAYDGDRVMAVFISGAKNTAAARTALKINYAVQKIINPLLTSEYPKKNYQLQQVVGIDTSELLVARIGVRNDNDLVWVGRAANYAAKLCAMNGKYCTYITRSVYSALLDDAKHDGPDKKPMWEKVEWDYRTDITVYGSTWTWSFA